MKFRFRHRFVALLGLMGMVGFLFGCDETKVAKPTDKGSSPWAKDHWTNVKPAQSAPGRIDPRYGRKARRVSLHHLRSLIPKLFNGLDWARDPKNPSKDNQWARFSATLGQADYIYRTQSHRTPTPLFMKFMDDMAGNLCRAAVAKDKANNNPKTAMILRHERSPDQNLRYLRLKFHTIYVPEDSTEGIQALRTLYDKALASSQSSHKAWELVCVAMVSSPEFFAY